MADTSLLENILDRISARWGVAHPAPSAGDTTEVKPKSDDREDDLPLGFGNQSWRYYEHATRLVNDRKSLYEAYDEMDQELPEASSAWDIYADNATRGADDGAVTLAIKSDSPRAAQILTETRDRLKVEAMLWPLARDIGKYGERAAEVIVDVDTFDVLRLKPLPTEYIIPQVDEFGRPKDPPYTQVDDKGDEVAKFQDWQLVHWANKKSLSDLTGTGLGYAARRAWKQLRMMEDAVVIARLTRAHNRLAYLVDTGSMTPPEGQKHLAKVKGHLAKRRTIDPRTGKMDTSYNPMQVEQDVFVAVHKESKADVKVLQGDLTVGNLADLEYFQQKVFTTFKVPKPYLAHEKDTRAKNIVTAQDIQFARTVRRVQQVMLDGLRQVFDLALLLKGVNPRTVKYTLALPVISIVDDLRVWQTEQLKMLVVQMMKQTLWPSDEWLLTHMLGYDADEAKGLLKDQKKPDQYNGLYQAPKVGATANNAKVGAKEADTDTLAAFRRAYADADEATRASVDEAIENLRLLSDWSLERLTSAE